LISIPQNNNLQQNIDYMHSLAAMPYPVQATAFWAIELAYNQGWHNCVMPLHHLQIDGEMHLQNM